LGQDEHSIEHYWKIYKWLVVLFLISFIGPFIAEYMPTEGFAGTLRVIFVLFVAFFIAVVKAWLVAKNFMHVKMEKRFMHYGLITALVFMLMFVAAASPDVMNHEGSNWRNVAASSWVEARLAEGPGDHHGEGHHDDGHGDGHGDGHDEGHGDGHGDGHDEGHGEGDAHGGDDAH